MKLPRKISPCPIIEVNIEIRFDTIMPSDAVFGVVYEKFKDEFKDLEKLPILQLPEEIRTHYPSLIFKPYYRLKNGNLILAIGPKIINFSCINDYIGWDNFSKEVKNVFDKVKKTAIFDKINRLGIRYINYFEDNIFDNIKLNIKIENDVIKSKQTYLRTLIESGDFVNTLQIADNANIVQRGETKVGSIIDIDTAIENTRFDLSIKLNELIENAHTEEKRLFFSLLNYEFLSKLNLEY